MPKHDPSVGDMLREWRERRRMSQLALVLELKISPRHMRFVGTGRPRPSQGLLLKLADQLGLPLREQNALQLAVGYAPTFTERPISSPDMRETMALIDCF